MNPKNGRAEGVRGRATRIREAVASPPLRPLVEEFVGAYEVCTGMRLTPAGAGDLLAQHLTTKPLFDALFAHHPDLDGNPISRAVAPLLDRLDDREDDPAHAPLLKRVAGIGSDTEHQQAIVDVYGDFFKTAAPRDVDALGIVYTPVEVVDFMLRSTEQALNKQGRSLTDEGVLVVDPFTGTGIFPVRLLQSGLIMPADLPRKYARELHAHEIVPFAHYIATVNVEAAFHALHGGPYRPYTGIALADTFDPAGCGVCNPPTGRAGAVL